MSGVLWAVLAVVWFGLGVGVGRMVGGGIHIADVVEGVWDEPVADDLPTYVPAPPERKFSAGDDTDIWQALQWSRMGQPCPPVLADEIADRRRAKAEQS